MLLSYTDCLPEIYGKVAGFVPADDDLVELIHRATKKNQVSEGMYLWTVPCVVATWLDEQTESAAAGGESHVNLEAVSFDSLIVDLQGLARRDPRFSGSVDRAIKKLKAQKWGGLTVSECFGIVDQIKAEVDRVAMDLFLEESEAAGHEARIREAAARMNLSSKQLNEHVQMNMGFQACEAFSVPYQWIRWIS